MVARADQHTTRTLPVNECDSAVFVFGPDDKIHSRDGDYDAPRDNVVLELGLFLASSGVSAFSWSRRQKPL
jgi:predicted nucleotide-binding protein